MEKSHIPHQDLSDPADYGQKWSSSPSWYGSGDYTTPESVIHLTMCGCKTMCKKNGLKCSELCKCQDCETLEHEDLESAGENALLEEEGIEQT